MYPATVIEIQRGSAHGLGSVATARRSHAAARVVPAQHDRVVVRPVVALRDA